MKTRININYVTLYRSLANSCGICALIFGVLYLVYGALHLLFSDPAVFAAILGTCVGLGALIGYDADGFQWDNNPRIAIRQLRAGDKGDRDD